MLTIPFNLGKTYGGLAADPKVQQLWDEYSLERWRRDTDAARGDPLKQAGGGTPSQMYGEVQMLLEAQPPRGVCHG